MKRIIIAALLTVLPGCSNNPTQEPSQPLQTNPTAAARQDVSRPVRRVEKAEGSASEVMESFLKEYFEGSTPSLTAFLEKHTDWPDFGPGDSWRIATGYSIREIGATESSAQFEVTFTAIGEGNPIGISLDEREEVVMYNLENRQGYWRIVEPINMPYVSTSSLLRSFEAYYLKEPDERLAQAIATLRQYSPAEK